MTDKPKVRDVLSQQELDSIKLQIRGDDKMVRAHLKIDGKKSIFIAHINRQIVENHPQMFDAFKELCKVAMTLMIESATGTGTVVDTIEKAPDYNDTGMPTQ